MKCNKILRKNFHWFSKFSTWDVLEATHSPIHKCNYSIIIIKHRSTISAEQIFICFLQCFVRIVCFIVYRQMLTNQPTFNGWCEWNNGCMLTFGTWPLNCVSASIFRYDSCNPFIFFSLFLPFALLSFGFSGIVS